jgi:hypothetical protein
MIYARTTTTVPKKRNKWKKFKGGHKIQTFKANIFKQNFVLDICEQQFEQGKNRLQQ